MLKLEHHSILNLNFNKIQINSFSIKMNKILIVSLASLMLTSAAPSYDLKYYGHEMPENKYNLGIDYTKHFDTNSNFQARLDGTIYPKNVADATAELTYRNNDNSVSYKRTETPQYSNQQFSGTANLYNDGTHKLNFNGWAGNTKRFRRQFEYEKFGGNFEYQHRNGHSLSLGSNVIPKLDQQTIDVTGNANIWRSDDKLSSLNAYGSASHHVGSYQPDLRTDYKTGLTFEHRF
ncbi:hypothetical protein PVAND_010707 [Polypedilum vanderplanki]|uniref:Attacin C-terminal domain-containing protein n=1 Tax=Polypedilum vanderplanki TaxID=319348 RepID=A0A9J6CHC8_POLVA|nr:hypothetical protein PVAND_010707 [Polypedilum vanderplanki]